MIGQCLSNKAESGPVFIPRLVVLNKEIKCPLSLYLSLSKKENYYLLSLLSASPSTSSIPNYKIFQEA